MHYRSSKEHKSLLLKEYPGRWTYNGRKQCWHWLSIWIIVVYKFICIDEYALPIFPADDLSGNMTFQYVKNKMLITMYWVTTDIADCAN